MSCVWFNCCQLESPSLWSQIWLNIIEIVLPTLCAWTLAPRPNVSEPFRSSNCAQPKPPKTESETNGLKQPLGFPRINCKNRNLRMCQSQMVRLHQLGTPQMRPIILTLRAILLSYLKSILWLRLTSSYIFQKSRFLMPHGS